MKPAQRDPWRRIDAIAAGIVIGLILITLCADLIRLAWRQVKQ